MQSWDVPWSFAAHAAILLRLPCLSKREHNRLEARDHSCQIRSPKPALSGELTASRINRKYTDFAGRTAGGSITFRMTEPRTTVSTRLGVAKGLNVWGADVPFGVGEPAFLFGDLTLEANQAIGKAMVLRLAATGRWTRDRLPAAQRFNVGGATFGRAFDDGLVAGDRGAAGSAEIAARPLRKGRIAPSEVYGFFDYADVTLLSRPTIPRIGYQLGSWGGGIRVAYADHATTGVELADAWKQLVPGFDQGWRVALNWKLSIRP